MYQINHYKSIAHFMTWHYRPLHVRLGHDITSHVITLSVLHDLCLLTDGSMTSCLSMKWGTWLVLHDA